MKYATSTVERMKDAYAHPLSWSSTRIRRDCRSILMAEAYALSNAVEHGLRTRAVIVDMKGQLNMRQWEETASAAMGHVWCADCVSTLAHSVSLPVPNKLTTHVWRSTCQLRNNSSGTTVMIVTRRSVDRKVIVAVGLTLLRCCQIA